MRLCITLCKWCFVNLTPVANSDQKLGDVGGIKCHVTLLETRS